MPRGNIRFKETITTIPDNDQRALPYLPDFARTFPKPKTTVFGVFPYIFRPNATHKPQRFRLFLKGPTTDQDSSRIFPILPRTSRTAGNTGIDCDYSRNDPSPPDFSRIFPMPKTTVFDTQGIDFDYSWNDPSTPDFSRIFPIFSELSRTLETPCLVRGIDCDYSRNDPSTPDFSRTLPKPKTTVFGVFAHIFRCEESIATIPETIRALPIFPELSRSLKPPCLVQGIDCDHSRNDPSPPDFSRIFLIFPELCRRQKHRVRGIDCDYSRNDPSNPDFSRTLPKARNTVFGVFPYIFRFEESIATIPETIRALPIFPELSRSIKTPTKESIATIPETDPSISDFRQTSDRLSASKKISKREDAWPQATPLAAKLPLGSEAARGGGAAAPASLAELGN
ncbi:hypothetical protein NQ317_002610 [Molorchus minor]|uniref:Uncharacterized protein n=1 Tax=Molorchus minor TaxID=1323400 RepID=A0ABQ9JUJ0_9CUCU|nr:hypothetical protein NQ317_002610 [Molorchus minor]